MPSKKKKYNARFPAGRIKKIMQTDEEIGKVAQAVPVIISRTLELFVESLLKRAMQITSAKNAKTLTPTHMKQCILSESRFDFLKDLVKGIPDVSSTDDEFGAPSGNMSPGTPLSAKAYGSYSCFQFHQSPDCMSSKSSSATMYNPIAQTSQPKFYKEIPIGGEDCENRICENVTPSFFCGTTTIQHTGSQLSNHCSSFPPPSKVEGNPSLIRTISGRNVTQLNELKLSSCNKTSEGGKETGKQERNGEEEEEEEDDDEDEDENGEGEEGVPELEENGYHKEGNTAKTCTIDEDYDT